MMVVCMHVLEGVCWWTLFGALGCVFPAAGICFSIDWMVLPLFSVCDDATPVRDVLCVVLLTSVNARSLASPPIWASGRPTTKP